MVKSRNLEKFDDDDNATGVGDDDNTKVALFVLLVAFAILSLLLYFSVSKLLTHFYVLMNVLMHAPPKLHY